MPVIQRNTSLGAGASVSLFAGSAFEIARTRQVVSIGVVQSVTGCFVTINSGSDVVAEEFEPAILTTYPVVPDQMYYNDVMEPNDRLTVSVRNPTGGAVTIKGICQVSQIA